MFYLLISNYLLFDRFSPRNIIFKRNLKRNLKLFLFIYKRHFMYIIQMNRLSSIKCRLRNVFFSILFRYEMDLMDVMGKDMLYYGEIFVRVLLKSSENLWDEILSVHFCNTTPLHHLHFHNFDTDSDKKTGKKFSVFTLLFSLYKDQKLTVFN